MVRYRGWAGGRKKGGWMGGWEARGWEAGGRLNPPLRLAMSPRSASHRSKHAGMA